jgi:hypothetical protein
MRMTLIFFTAVLTAIPVVAQSPSAAVTADPAIDVTHKARMEVVHIPTHGLNINGVFYLAAGAGPHATLVFFTGFLEMSRILTSPRRFGEPAGTS